MQLWIRLEATSSRTAAHSREISSNSSKMRLSMNLVQYVCSLRMAPTSDRPIASNTCAHEAIKSCVRCMQKQQSRSLRSFPPSLPEEVSPLASVGEAHSCPPAQLQIRRVSCSSGEMGCMPSKHEIVDADIDDEANEVQQSLCCCGRTWTDQAGDRTPCCIWTCIELGVMRA